jgi:5'-methylthioadenosine nucleosidase
VATTAAAVSTYASIAHFKPDIVISAGTAGGFSELGASIGDVYISTKCIFHGRRIPISFGGDAIKSKSRHLEEYGFGHFRSPPLYRLAKCLQAKQGVVSSSDSLDCTAMDFELLRSEGAVVKEMESAAVAWVCQQLGVTFFALKAITDIVDGPRKSEDEFYSNLVAASSKLQIALSSVIWHIGGTDISMWGVNSPDCGRDSDKTSTVFSAAAVAPPPTHVEPCEHIPGINIKGADAYSHGGGVSVSSSSAPETPKVTAVIAESSTSSSASFPASKPLFMISQAHYVVSKDFVHGFVFACVALFVGSKLFNIPHS